jgi:hypothetical protein
MKNKKVVSGILSAALAVAVMIGLGQNATVKQDTELSGPFGLVTISGSGTAEDWLEVNASAATMRQLRISGNYIHVSGGEVSNGESHGVLITGKNVIVEGMRVHNGVTENGATKCSGTGGWGSAIKVQVGGENVVIRNNEVYENCGEGIGITRGVNVSVEGNRVWDNFSVNIYLDNSPNSRAVNNYIACGNPNYFRNWPPAGPARGVMIGIEYFSGWGNQAHDILVDGNTIEKCGGVSLYKDTEMKTQTLTNTTISNNVFIGVPTPFVNVAGAIVFNNAAGNGTPTATSTPTVSPAPTGTPTRAITKTPAPTNTPAPATMTPAPAASLTALPVTLWKCDVSATLIKCEAVP